MLQTCQLKAIERDWSYNFRPAINDDAVSQYRDAVDNLPPMRLVRIGDGRLLLVDGFHRYEALQAEGHQYSVCDITDGDERDALFIAATCNAQHGMILDKESRNRAIVALAEAEFPYKEIAPKFGLSPHRISSIAVEHGKRLRPTLSQNGTAIDCNNESFNEEPDEQTDPDDNNHWQDEPDEPDEEPTQSVESTALADEINRALGPDPSKHLDPVLSAINNLMATWNNPLDIPLALHNAYGVTTLYTMMSSLKAKVGYLQTLHLALESTIERFNHATSPDLQ